MALTLALLFVWLLCFGASAAPSFSREQMLRELAQNVIVPGYTNLAARCAELTNALEQLAQSPTADALERAQRSWAAAAQAADRLQCFQSGPMTDHDFASTFFYWQVVPIQIEDILNSSQAINESLLDQAGATTKGLYAAEYLLFDRRGGQATEPPAPAKALELLAASARRREYLLALGRDLGSKANQLAADWRVTIAQGAAAKFVSAGQDSVNLLVNQLSQKAESLGQNRLKLASLLPSPVSHHLYRIEGSRSGSSLQGVLATLGGMQRAYEGGRGVGLRAAVDQLNPALAERVHDGFEAATAAVREVGPSLEQQVLAGNRAPLQNAYDKLHALEILLKVDVASTLGVTITFTSGDGD